MISYDAEEYLQLALNANSKGDLHVAMSYLKELLIMEPQNSTGIYLLATLHAELGLLDRAVRGIRAALLIQPTLKIARLQLGLLLFDIGQFQEAKEQFRELCGSQNDALTCYSEGLVAFVDGNLSEAREKLSRGLQQQTDSMALAALMKRMLERIDAQMAADQSQLNTISMGAYQQSAP